MNRATCIFDFVQRFSDALDLVVPQLNGHHRRVAYIAQALAEALRFPPAERHDVLVAGMLHDAGALTLKSRFEALEFETRGADHCELGYRLLRQWPVLSTPAAIIRRHHARYEERDGAPRAALVIHLADRVDVLIRRDRFILDQIPDILEAVKARSGTMFDPVMTEALLDVARRECFWLDVVSPALPAILNRIARKTASEEAAPDLDAILDFSRLFSHVIDFRSRFTAAHSAGVARVCAALADMTGFPKGEVNKLRIAGRLHDLGKLAVPAELIEKNGPLTQTEFNLIKSHAYHTDRLLEGLNGLKDMAVWAATHHERLDGSGYPFHIAGEALGQGTRILNVADVFTAISEDRPYRKGMGKEQAVRVLRDMTGAGSLDGRIAQALIDDFDAVEAARRQAQDKALTEYEAFRG